MKKLNRKGFTLVELLAVIIILAIVVGISIPAITNIINDSKNNALGTATNAAEKFISDQYAFMQVDNTNVNSAFLSAYNNGTITVSDALIEAMGFQTKDVNTVTVTLDTETGKACVSVTEIPTSSQYFTTKYWTANGDKASAADGAATQNKSKGC